MKFALSEDQRLLADSLERWLAGEADGLDRKALEDAPDSGAEAFAGFRRQAAEMGVGGVLVDAARGGSGLGLLEAALVAEKLGRHCAPMNFYASGVLGPLALAMLEKAGDAGAAGALLDGLAGGGKNIGVGWSLARRDGAGLEASGNGLLSGTALMVSDCPGADAWLLAEPQTGVWLVPGGGGEAQAMPSVDLQRRHGELRLDGAEAVQVAAPDSAEYLRLLDAGRVALAADMLGAAERTLQMAVDYAQERQQFGRVIGSFQAVKHLCAEMSAALEPCRALVWYAAYAWDHGLDDARLVAGHAKAQLSEVAQQVSRTATEVHGGIGFTDEYGLHRWFKRIGLNRQLLGGPGRVREELARLQGWC